MISILLTLLMLHVFLLGVGGRVLSLNEKSLGYDLSACLDSAWNSLAVV